MSRTRAVLPLALRLLAALTVAACGDDLVLPEGPAGPTDLVIVGAGTGAGSVRPEGTDDPALTCLIEAGEAFGDGCVARYGPEEEVTLAATPELGSVFAGWSGACTNATGPCVVPPGGRRTVTATFTATSFRISLAGVGEGRGVIASIPEGIDCTVTAGAVSGTCFGDYPAGSTVTLSVTPATGHRFIGWGGACGGTEPTCPVVLDANVTVSAAFAPPDAPPQFPLTVAGAGTGAGTVTSQPGLSPAIECGIDGGRGSAGCGASYSRGTSATLTATPAAGSRFDGWSGACSGTGPCAITVDEPTTVTARFSRIPEPDPDPDPEPPGETGLIAFDTRRDGNFDVWVMRPDGSGQRPLVATGRDERHPAWSPDGRRIAFQRDVGGGNTEIFVVNADGTGERRLTNRPGLDEHPFWSPDGASIAFVRETGGDRDIWAMAPDGSGARDLTDTDGDDYNPAWSPDGSRIAFQSTRDGNSEVYVMDANGANQRRLTTSEADDGYPAWAPDGQRLAFTHQIPGTRNWDIWVMRADGSDQRALTTSPNEDYAPAWSPDGRQIAWTSRPPGPNDYEIWIMNADGTSPRNVTQAGGEDWRAAWRP